jgi:hypothetical protein
VWKSGLSRLLDAAEPRTRMAEAPRLVAVN